MPATLLEVMRMIRCDTSEPMELGTGKEQFNAVYTIQLGELIEDGLMDWTRPELDWSEASFSPEQYERVCEYFNSRFYWREISIIPFLEWADYVRRKLVYELMPKYLPLYERVAQGISPFADMDEYYKGREIGSTYPETLLSGNADYITDGKDEEFERIKEGNPADKMENFIAKYKGVDEALLDELESMFICMYTLNVNSGW